MRVDYHTHHYRCGHASGQLAQYVEAAIAAGLDEIGLSDHGPVIHLGDHARALPATAMSAFELPNYVAEMIELRDRYAGRITVRLGVESDYVLGWDDHYRRMWREYPLDYVIGSVHYLGDWLIFNRQLPSGRPAADVYQEYLLTTQAAARSGVYDVIGHLDCLKTVGHIADLNVTPLLDETIRVLAECGVAVELNTSGWRKTCDDCYPRAEVLARCLHYGVPVTLGSDAHAPHQVASNFDRAVALLRETGYTHVTTFSQRRRLMVPLT